MKSDAVGGVERTGERWITLTLTGKKKTEGKRPTSEPEEKSKTFFPPSKDVSFGDSLQGKLHSDFNCGKLGGKILSARPPQTTLKFALLSPVCREHRTLAAARCSTCDHWLHIHCKNRWNISFDHLARCVSTEITQAKPHSSEH